MRSSTSRVAVLVISLPLLGCSPAPHEATLQSTCDANAMRRHVLIARQASLMADMNRDVALGKGGGVPGRSFDAKSTQNADAYARRIEETWGAADRALRDDLRDIDRQSGIAGCRAS